jgi:Domain of unknown function (DUF4386)
MNAQQKNSTSVEISLRNASIIAGFGYLMIFIFSIFANFFVFEKLIVSGDAATIANNIIVHESLFRFGITSWLIVIVFDALVAWALYIFLKPVNKSLSFLAALFRLVFVAIFGYSFVNYFSILQLFSGADYLKAFQQNQLQAQTMLLLNSHYYAVNISYVFFGLHIFLLGYLILKSGYIPRMIGILLLVASCGYLINSFGNFLSSAYKNNSSAFLIFVGGPALVSELSLTIWLLFKGRKASAKIEMTAADKQND